MFSRSARIVLFVLSALAASARADDDKKKNELPPADPNANKLTREEEADGWKLLFDGSKLTGLRSLRAGDPLKSGWTIDRNALVLPKTIQNQGKVTGGDLLSTIAYDDFEFRFDFRLAASSDSGILYFARAAAGQRPTGHEFQIIDDVHHPDGLKGGPLKQTGALYGILPRLGENFVRMAERWNEEHWNHGVLIVEGKHVEHWLNSEKVLEYDLGPDLLKKATAQKVKLPPGFGSKTKSPIILLDQGDEIAFRNLKIRPLSPPPPSAPAPATSPATPAQPGTPRVAPTPFPRQPQQPIPTR
jgi:hypothetical protein